MRDEDLIGGRRVGKTTAASVGIALMAAAKKAKDTYWRNRYRDIHPDKWAPTSKYDGKGNLR